eukprot:GHVH01004300.1.p1 GENE.GHVH01004300.1~~GHVH01004300.1.p1  ORF type:complete len:141 (+),score=5.58 GHVH01004300.1:235-657(+)
MHAFARDARNSRLMPSTTSPREGCSSYLDAMLTFCFCLSQILFYGVKVFPYEADEGFSRVLQVILCDALADLVCCSVVLFCARFSVMGSSWKKVSSCTGEQEYVSYLFFPVTTSKQVAMRAHSSRFSFSPETASRKRRTS